MLSSAFFLTPPDLGRVTKDRFSYGTDKGSDCSRIEKAEERFDSVRSD